MFGLKLAKLSFGCLRALCIYFTLWNVGTENGSKKDSRLVVIIEYSQTMS